MIDFCLNSHNDSFELQVFANKHIKGVNLKGKV